MAHRRQHPKARNWRRPAPDEPLGTPAAPRLAKGPARTETELRRDYETISGLYLKGWTHQRIAEYISKDPDRPYALVRQTISTDMRKIRAMWAENATADIQELINKQLAALDNLEAELWEAYERSKGNAESSTVVTREKSAGDKDAAAAVERTATINTKGQVGDVAYLNAIERVIGRRCAILGITTPTKLEGTAGKVPDGFEFTIKIA